MTVVTPFKEAADMVKEAGGIELDQCYQCGLCTGSCPWNLVSELPVRKLIHQAQLGIVDLNAEYTWMCTTCRNCVQRCPRGVDIIDIMKAMRRVVAETGISKVPESLWLAVSNIAGSGNPLGQPAGQRGDWAKPLRTKYKQKSELLYFPCCIPAYDSKVNRVAYATVRILQAAGAEHTILPYSENCCGESVRKSGHEGIFSSLVQKNISAFNAAGVKEIIVSSPHCYYTFKQEYPKLGGEFVVTHVAQYVARLINEGRLKFAKSVNKKVAYHDSCYLGRHSGIYDEPRTVLESIPGIELVEMTDFRENALCCGGGGGRIWMDTKKGERFSDVRLQQAASAGAAVLAVSCPYCMLNFEDSLLDFPAASSLQVQDLAEIVCEAL